MKVRIILNQERCKGCELCVSVCNQHVLVMTSRLNSRGDHYPETQDLAQCTGCRHCAVICPDAAIEIEAEDDSCSPEC